MCRTERNDQTEPGAERRPPVDLVQELRPQWGSAHRPPLEPRHPAGSPSRPTWTPGAQGPRPSACSRRT
eukprot:11403525-Alexandrium_andersonii.AAC.1